MVISVTQNHITRGRRNNCYSCPIALAIIDATGCNKVVVNEDSVYYSYYEEDGTHRGFYHRLPRSAMKFVKEFDESEGEACRPFKFKLTEKTRCQ